MALSAPERAGETVHPKNSTEVFQEVVGIFKSTGDLQSAIRELENVSFTRQDISVMGGRGELERVFGTKTVSPHDALAHDDIPRQSPSRPEEQTIGVAGMIGGSAYVGAMALALAAGAVTFPAIMSAAVIGGIGGGTLGAVLSRIMGGRYTRHMEEQIEKGGLLLWVRADTQHKIETAKQIMTAHNGYDVHVQKRD